MAILWRQQNIKHKLTALRPYPFDIQFSKGGAHEPFGPSNETEKRELNNNKKKTILK